MPPSQCIGPRRRKTAVEHAQQKDCLIIEHINARSLLANITEIRLLIASRNIDILCVSETRLLPHTPDSYIYIPGYNVYRCDKDYGGGVCMYVKYCLATNELTSNADRPNGVEDVWLSIQCRKLPSVIVGCVYRHPKDSKTPSTT